MAVYVDNMQISWRGKLWCHLVADSLDELHEFAAMLDLPRSWFHRRASHPHYDVTTDVRLKTIREGAQVVSGRHVLEVAKTLSRKEVGKGRMPKFVQEPLF